jgi:hypothetical protein
MGKYTHDKQMEWTEPRVLFDVLPAVSLSGSDNFIPPLHTAVVGT